MNDLLGLISENLNNDNVEIAYVNKDDESQANKINKNDFLQKTKTNLRMKDICLLLQDLSWYERFEWVHQKKLKGNRFIKKNKIEEATNTYMEALMGLDLQNGTSEEKERVRTDLQIPLLMNLASCFLKKKEYATSINLYTSGIKINCNYYKLYMKRGYAYKCLKEYEKASDDFSMAYKLATDDSERQDVKESFEDFKRQKEKETQVLKKYFDGNPHKVNSEKIDQMNGENEDEEVLCYNDEWEEMEKFKALRWVLYPTKKTYGFFKSRIFNCCRRNSHSDLNRNLLKSLYSKGSDYFYNLTGADEE